MLVENAQRIVEVDLGEASAINDAASRVGGVVLIALVPALLGTGTAGLAQSLATGYQSAMLIMAGLSLLAALITALFVSRTGKPIAHLPAPPRVHGCAVSEPA